MWWELLFTTFMSLSHFISYTQAGLQGQNYKMLDWRILTANGWNNSWITERFWLVPLLKQCGIALILTSVYLLLLLQTMTAVDENDATGICSRGTDELKLALKWIVLDLLLDADVSQSRDNTLSIESKCGTTLMIGALLLKVETKVALKEEAMAEERTNKIEIALRWIDVTCISVIHSNCQKANCKNV